MRVRFWGTRGSIATPGPGTNHFGGNTSCVELTTADGGLLILDCGTGAHRLAAELMAKGKQPINANILIGHTHWDHIQGFPFFGPAFVKGNSARSTARKAAAARFITSSRARWNTPISPST
jgi:phosphoribosyl 1,2-cyclic phosphodiesterase